MKNSRKTNNQIKKIPNKAKTKLCTRKDASKCSTLVCIGAENWQKKKRKTKSIKSQKNSQPVNIKFNNVKSSWKKCWNYVIYITRVKAPSWPGLRGLLRDYKYQAEADGSYSRSSWNDMSKGIQRYVQI